MMVGEMNGTDSPGDAPDPAHRRPSAAPTTTRSRGPTGWARRRPVLVAVLALAGVLAAGAALIVLRVVPGTAGAAGGAPFQEDHRRVSDQIISVFENDDPEIHYDYIDDLDDGRGYTAGRAGFCTACGDLLKLVQRYTERVPGNPLAAFMPELDRLADEHSDDVRGLDGFEQAWTEAAEDRAFRDTQDDLVDELYFRPAAEIARQHGVRTPLGVLVLYDTAIQHGTSNDRDALAGIARRTVQAAGGTPGTGVDEMEWLRVFLGIRRDVLLNPSDPSTAEVWRASVGRADALRKLIDEGRAQLEPPITINPFGRPHTVG